MAAVHSRSPRAGPRPRREQLHVVATPASSDSDESSTGGSSAAGGCGQLMAPLVVFAAFFLNFIVPDMKSVSRRYETILTPPDYAFAIWALIYSFEFFFVIYQLFFSKPRTSRLIQARLPWLWVGHQILVAVWLLLFPRNHIVAATIVITFIWLFALGLFVSVTTAFRTRTYAKPTATDYAFLEVPFALLLGWETLATIISWNVFFLEMFYQGRWTHSQAVTSQVVGLLGGFAVIAVAAVLFAGVPMIMDPVVHLPILWGLGTLGAKQWTEPGEALGWSTTAISSGVAISAWLLCGIVLLFASVAACIFTSGRVCFGDEVLDEPEPDMDDPSYLDDGDDIASALSNLSPSMRRTANPRYRGLMPAAAIAAAGVGYPPSSSAAGPAAAGSPRAPGSPSVNFADPPHSTDSAAGAQAAAAATAAAAAATHEATHESAHSAALAQAQGTNLLATHVATHASAVSRPTTSEGAGPAVAPKPSQGAAAAGDLQPPGSGAVAWAVPAAVRPPGGNASPKTAFSSMELDEVTNLV